MMVDQVRKVVEKIDWIKAVQTLGFPVVMAGVMLYIGYQFVQNQASQSAKDSETRQELLKELVQAQIENTRQTANALVKMDLNVDEMRRISAQSSENDKKVIENQGKIIEAVTKDCESGKELIAVQKKILETLQTKQVPR